MSWLSTALGGAGRVLGNVGSTVKKAVVDTGHAVGSVADNPWTKAALAAGLAATGVGAPAAAAIMAGEGLGGGLLKPGGNIGSGVKSGVVGGALGYGAGSLGTALRAGGGLGGTLRALPGVGGMIPGGTAPVPGADGGYAGDGGYGGDYGSAPDEGGGGGGGGGIVGPTEGGTIGDTSGSGDGGGILSTLEGAGKRALGGIASGIGNAVTNATTGHGVADIAMAGLAGASALNAANAAKRAGAFQDQAINLANTNWAAGAPLRTAGQAGMLNPVRPNLTSTYVDASNPFASAPRALPGAATRPV